MKKARIVRPLKIIMREDSGAKKCVTDGFKKADEYDDKVKKAREKFELVIRLGDIISGPNFQPDYFFGLS